MAQDISAHLVGAKPTQKATVLAVVFPGQGVQRPGMAGDFYESFASARTVFEQASDVLGFDVARLCHDDDPRLNQTAYTQPSILTAEIAMLSVLRNDFGLRPRLWGGHSLGEYAALVGAGAIPFDSAVRLVHERGRLMQQAVPRGEGGMMAVIQPNLDPDGLAEHVSNHGVDIANLNSPDQVVLSGPTSELRVVQEQLENLLAPLGGRVVPLNVSAPFHSRYMRSVEAAFRELLVIESPRFEPAAATAVTSNVTGGFHDATHDGLIDAMTHQLSGTVRWIENMRSLLAAGADQIIEIGPGRPLRGFFKAMRSSVDSVVSVRSAARLLRDRN